MTPLHTLGSLFSNAFHLILGDNEKRSITTNHNFDCNISTAPTLIHAYDYLRLLYPFTHFHFNSLTVFSLAVFQHYMENLSVTTFHQHKLERA